MKDKGEAAYWNHIRMKTCPVCGKQFVPAGQHAYKIRKNGSDKKACSWSCVSNWRKQKEEIKKQRKGDKKNG